MNGSQGQHVYVSWVLDLFNFKFNSKFLKIKIFDFENQNFWKFKMKLSDELHARWR